MPNTPQNVGYKMVSHWTIRTRSGDSSAQVKYGDEITLDTSWK